MARMNKREAIRKDAREGFYAEWEEEFEMYAVFGLETGFCYGQHHTESAAEDHAENLNDMTAEWREEDSSD